MKEDAITTLKLEGVNKDSSDTAVINAISDKLTAAERKVKTLEQEKEALEKKANEENEKAIKAAVEAGKKAGKIKPELVATYEDMGEKMGLEDLNKVIQGLPGKPGITQSINSQADPAPSGKSWDEMQKDEPRKLEAMSDPKHAEHETFKALFKEKYGQEYQD